MGWVGIGALAASVAFLLYYHPPSSWTFAAQSPPPRTETTSEPSGDTALRKDTEKRVEVDAKRSDDCSPETTPKAAPVNPSPQVNIPSFNLDDGSGSLDKPTGTTSSVSNTSQPVSSPSDKPANPSSLSLAIQNPAPPSLAPPRLKPLPHEQGAAGGSPGLMPPPPRPSPNASLRPPPSAASSLRVPATKSAPGTGLTPAPLQARAKNTSKQITLKPGHSPLDWAALTATPNHTLRGANLPPTLIRVTPSMLKAQNGRKGRDAWTSYQNKVYNITPFLPFHPGGEGELMRGAGKDSAKLFLEYHPWVNWDGMLGECLVGILVSEEDGAQNSGVSELDTMD